MYLTDYHLHTEFSFDGQEKIDDICERAIERGINEIALTDHMDIYTNKPYGHILECKNLYEQIEKAKDKFEGRLIVKAGVELGQQQVNIRESEQFLTDYKDKLDFVIGSIHNMKDDSDIYYYDFSKLDCIEVYNEYMDWLLELAKGHDFDVLGHLTYPIRYMYMQVQKKIPLERFEERFRLLFKILVERGKGIEVNTSGIFQAINETMPPLYLVKLYKECGGEIITVGSDAHKLEHVALTIREGQEIIKEAGFEYVTVFNKRKPEFKRIM